MKGREGKGREERGGKGRKSEEREGKGREVKMSQSDRQTGIQTYIHLARFVPCIMNIPSHFCHLINFAIFVICHLC